MKNKIICWDSSVLISHLGGDGDKNLERQPIIGSIVSIVDRGDYKLLVSTLLYVEVLDSDIQPEAINLLDKFMQNRKRVTAMAVNSDIAKKAQSIRNQVSLRLKTPDAIHIATAIVGGASVLHTFDKRLLNLSEDNKVDGLAITPCDIPGASPPLTLDI